VENSWQNRARRNPHEEIEVFRKPDLSSTHFIYQLKVDKLKHFEVQIGGAANPVTPRADE
jgi:hypothetical protein